MLFCGIVCVFFIRILESVVCVLGTLESTLQILWEAGEMDWDLMLLFTLTGKQLQQSYLSYNTSWLVHLPK